MNREFDLIDRRILDELQANGRLSIVELAARVHLTKTPCSERVRRLERSGVIQGYRAVLDQTKIEMNHVTIVHVSLSRTNDMSLHDFGKAVQDIPEVQTCMMIAGSFDFMLKVVTKDMAHFREVHGDQIGKLPHVTQTHSFAVMEIVKDSSTFEMARSG
ncbi:UNVERIFIED_CONTAM: hypothetical protein GTU68_006742 [Idotea baltica]|nr:hypothetical protein [Idotea baltica]